MTPLNLTKCTNNNNNDTILVGENEKDPIPKCVNNIVMVFAGGSHRDPATIGLTRQYMEKFHSMNIPQIFCSELPNTQTLEIKTSYENTNAENNDYFLKNISELNTVAIKHSDLAYPHFTFDSKFAIRKILSNVFPSMKESTRIQASEHIIRYVYTLESVLLNKQLLDLGISFQGLERPDEEYKQWSQNTLDCSNEKAKAILVSTEKMRIEEMTKNLFVKAFPQLEKSGGVIWVELGSNHSHNLAISVLNYIQKNNLTKKLSFTLLPTACFSLYAQDMKETLKLGTLEARNCMNQKDLLPLFDKLPLEFVEDIKENGKHQYESLKFNQLMHFVEKSWNKKNIFHIPSFDAQKKKIIEEKNGVIQKIDGDCAIVSIASEILLGPLREQLGIERRKLTFRKNYEDKIKKLIENPLITVEFLPNPQQVMATFPISQLDEVKALIG